MECAAQIFDGLGANSTAVTTVTVQKLQVNETQMHQLMMSQLTSATGSVDSTKKAISSATAVVNTVDCTSAPNCTALNRSICSQVAQTCGPCLFEGSFVGMDGNSNDPCVPVSALAAFSASGLPAHRRLTVQPCTADASCGPWGRCNLATLRCFVPAKQCTGNCSGVGQCVYQNAATGFAVKECSVGDPHCEAVCECPADFGGSDCSMTPQSLRGKQSIRAQLMTALANVVERENVNLQSIASWANSIAAITQSGEISAEVASTSTELVTTILNTASSLAYPASSVVGLLTAVDGISAVSSSRQSRRLVNATLAGGLRSAIDGMGALLVNGMVGGQQASGAVLSNFRMASQLVSAADGAVLDVPQTALEKWSGVATPSVTLGSNNPAASPQVKLSAISLKTTTFGAGSNNSSGNQFSSNPLRLHVGTADLCQHWTPPPQRPHGPATSCTQAISSSACPTPTLKQRLCSAREQ